MRALLPLLLLACSPKPAARAPMAPLRAATPGEALLARFPAGADAVLELDLARLRANATVGPALAAAGHAGLLGADVVVAAVYRLGRPEAATLILAAGAELDAAAAAAGLADAEVLDGGVLAVGPGERRDAARLAGAGAVPSLASQAALLAVRDEAMPTVAGGAVVRAAAILDAEARAAVAARLEIPDAPTEISVWGDVADDLGVVALLRAGDETAARRLAAAVVALRDRASTRFLLDQVTGGASLAGLDAQAKGRVARVVWVVGPRALERWADGLPARLAPPAAP